MAAPGRQYGLILPKAKQNTLALSKHSIFNDSDDETSVNENLQKESLKKSMMKQTKLEMQKALAEDATVYEYDSVYDDLQQKKLESNTKSLSGSNKQSKYIENLMKAVGERNKEQDRMTERKIQKEREAEGEKYVDKDAFVTSAYKKKLQERAEEKEQERRAADMEASLDVTKQKDLSGFYRHFLNQQVGEEVIPECSIRAIKGIKEEPEDNARKDLEGSSGNKPDQDPDADAGFDTGSDDETKAKHGQKQMPSKARNDGDNSDTNEDKARSRQYRRHAESSSDEEQSQRVGQSTREGRSEKGKSYSKTPRDAEKRSRSGERSSHKEHKRVKEKHREKDHSRKDRDRDRYQDNKERKIKEEKPKDHNSGRDERSRDYRERPRDDQARDEKLKERQRSKVEKYPMRDGRRKDEKKKENEEPEERNCDRDIQEAGGDPREPVDPKHGGSESKEDSSGNASDKEKSKEQCHKRSMLQEKDEQGNAELKDTGDEDKSLDLSSEQVLKDDSEKETNGPDHSQQLSKFVKRSNQETITSAKERYLARQMNRSSTKAYIEPEEND
ncbi:nuclear speckle splicing regulatory protein 1 [Leucoraja erinacea]|uniref:nuclear speckle splicing regulatory protein 1 n=1 Tax=Leucoraja erinaceus TaxID=7782 RepID=UPI0024590974|nr:nuclear speckle splicing regulatory protein 1 [Leucoraja erinacea]